MANTTNIIRKGTWADAVNLLLGAWLFLTPWLFSYTAENLASWNAWIAGLVIALLGIAALTAFAEWEEWVELIAGIWVAISPWVLGFSAVTSAMGWHVIVGVIVAVLAAVRLYSVRSDTQRLTPSSR